jgi:hypothetical protein
MDWKEQLNRATAAIKGAADNETVKGLTAKARQAASDLAKAAKKGAASAADAVTRATADPATVKMRYFNTEISIVSPSDGLQVTCPHAGALVISDGAGNALVISLAPPKPAVSETVGVVAKLNDTTFDLGPEDGVNVIVLKS